MVRVAETKRKVVDNGLMSMMFFIPLESRASSQFSLKKDFGSESSLLQRSLLLNFAHNTRKNRKLPVTRLNLEVLKAKRKVIQEI